MPQMTDIYSFTTMDNLNDHVSDTDNQYNHDDDSDHHTDDNNSNNIVKFQCERDWRRLKDVQAGLQDLEPVELIKAQDDDVNHEIDTSSRLQILRELEKRLKAELQFVKERELKTLPDNADLQLLVLEQNQVKKLDSLMETLTYSKALRSEVLEDIKQEEETYSSLRILNEALKKKVAVVDEASGDETGKTLESVLTEMTTKVKKVADMNKYFKDTLKEILSEHFPLPHLNGAGGVVEKSKDSVTSNMFSLRVVVGTLIEQSLNSPEQPYIDIDDRFWPPHIEFLLRCQIVLKDPHNSHRIKLVPFHL